MGSGEQEGLLSDKRLLSTSRETSPSTQPYVVPTLFLGTGKSRTGSHAPAMFFPLWTCYPFTYRCTIQCPSHPYTRQFKWVWWEEPLNVRRRGRDCTFLRFPIKCSCRFGLLAGDGGCEFRYSLLLYVQGIVHSRLQGKVDTRCWYFLKKHLCFMM